MGMADIKSPRTLYIKAGLFVIAGVIACWLILLEAPSVKVALLLGLAIWCFARAYYFAFYVIEKYVDPTYRFAGLTSFLRYLVAGRRRGSRGDGECRAPRGEP